MTYAQRLGILAYHGWLQDEPLIQHIICGERCWAFTGMISGVEWHAWIGETSGMAYIQTTPAIDMKWEEFVSVISNGWPVKKVAPASRGFDFGDDD